MRYLKLNLAVFIVLFAQANAVFSAELVMVSQPGCYWCAAWNKTIRPIYPKTDLGAFAPLIDADLRTGPPQGITYLRPVTFTPTFVLVEGGKEIGRLEGYPGDDFFWGLLEKLFVERTNFKPMTAVK